MKFSRRFAKIIVLTWLATWLSVIATSWLWPRDAPLPDAADAIICLGGGMSYMGWERPGPASSRRALTCAELMQAGVAPVVVFTGFGHEIMSVAEAMARLAEADGVPAEAMIVEPDARSTLQNAAFSLALLPAGTERIVIVSDAFHLPRSWLIFNLLDAPETAVSVYAARMAYTLEDGTCSRSYLGWTLRESVAIWANVARILAYFIGGLLGIDTETRITWFR